MNELELAKKVDIMEAQARECLVSAENVVRRWRALAEALEATANQFWGDKKVEADVLQREASFRRFAAQPEPHQRIKTQNGDGGERSC